MNKLSPSVKGLMTGIVMTALILIFFVTDQPANSGLQLVVYGVYAMGVIWTLIAYSKSAEYTRKFVDLFGQGFRCIIVVTLVLTTFTGIFSATHPEFAEKEAKAYKEYLISKKEKTPGEIDEMVSSAKKHYTTGLIYSSIFRYLFIGAAFTAAGAASLLIIRRRK